MYGDPVNPGASSGAYTSAQRSHSLSQSQPSSSSYPPTSAPLNSNRTSPFSPNPVATTTTITFSTLAPAPATTTSMAASVLFPQSQSFRPPVPPQLSYPAPFAPSFERDASNLVGLPQPIAESAVIVRRLPHDTTEQTLRLMCTFSNELLDVEILSASQEDDAVSRSAILRFKSLEGAYEAKSMLNGKKGLIVEHLTTSSSGASSATSPAAAATQAPRFDGTFSPLETTSPPIPGNYVTSDFGNARSSYNYKNFFSPQSPIGNHLSEQPRISGKSVINDATDDDDTGDILKDPRAFAENGSLAGQRRATAPPLPMLDRMTSLSLNTGATNGMSTSPHGHSGMYPSISTHANSMSPTAMNGVNGNSAASNPQWARAHALPPANPADQNPPCNTLYVGNLPMGTSEDELKALFSRQRGYKRLCFRAKSNGPMCFVEFEDISFATKALNELYGYTLSNSVRGGIRLSFSKNPLGVRTPQAPGQGPSGPLGGPSLLGHSMNGFAASGPPPGFSAPPGLSAGRTAGPYSSSNVVNGAHAANGSASYAPSTVPNGTSPLPFGNGASNFSRDPWATNSYFSSTISAPNPVTSPMTGAPHGSGTFSTYRRGQY